MNALTPQALADLSFTSGSSGLPRAIAHSVANHQASADASVPLLHLNADSRYLLSLSLAFASNFALCGNAAAAEPASGAGVLAARKLQEGDNRARKRDCTDRDAKAHFNAADGVNQAIRAIDAKCFRVQKRRRGNKHCGHTDKAVKRGNQLRHIRHRNFACGHPTDPATDKNRTQNFGQ